MPTGELIVRATVWVALLCYPVGALGGRVARLVWTLGCASVLVHVVSSFGVFYDWSHAVGLQETARQTEEATGIASGAGLWLNYLFTLVWLVDVGAWWLDEAAYRKRGWKLLVIEHAFLLFMIFNATVVFEDGATRLMGIVVTAAGIATLTVAVRRAR